ncbi:MAG: DNA mismatch repair endonuclease MutL [Desulfitobacteriaceae bacterium]|nr:DNA mismatch repair endonuclease MutL [Desulfitobacteriaceae bacterium]
MREIKVLDPQTANQIAAGEVVERPVSVVKELVENSIDAGATRIKISIREGGLKLIQVGDNGCGMTVSDMLMAPKRHATSKIENAEDLNSLHTLGFRGEALPSIAAVSKLSVTSRLGESAVGWQVVIENGTINEPVETGCPSGTIVRAESLFYNTPARKKFLKSAATELGHASDMIGRMILSHPDIAFELEHEEKNILKSPGNADLAQAIFAVYGGDIARKMKKISYHGEEKIIGFVSSPELTRSTRHYYNFFVNGRFVRSPELAAILEEAFYTRIPAKRYPVAVIHFTLDPETFDVNVHPAKLEIKFRNLPALKSSFIQALDDIFRRPADVIPGVTLPFTAPKTQPIQRGKDYPDQEIYQEKFQLVSEEPVYPQKMEVLPSRESEQVRKQEAEKQQVFSNMKVLGQLEGTYILASSPEGIYIIDQHAAHERIRFDKIKKAFCAQPSETEYLAVPGVIELTPQQALWLINNIVTIKDLGFILEHFGENTFLLRGVPRWNSGGNSEELLLAIVEKLGNDSDPMQMDRLVEEELFTIACKSAVKANRHLTEADIGYLLTQLELSNNPYSCPHGRPVLIKITRKEIEKRFMRS